MSKIIEKYSDIYNTTTLSLIDKKIRFTLKEYNIWCRKGFLLIKLQQILIERSVLGIYSSTEKDEILAFIRYEIVKDKQMFIDNVFMKIIYQNYTRTNISHYLMKNEPNFCVGKYYDKRDVISSAFFRGEFALSDSNSDFLIKEKYCEYEITHILCEYCEKINYFDRIDNVCVLKINDGSGFEYKIAIHKNCMSDLIVMTDFRKLDLAQPIFNKMFFKFLIFLTDNTFCIDIYYFIFCLYLDVHNAEPNMTSSIYYTSS